MAGITEELQSKLDKRSRDNALRTLVTREGLVDLCSNDYLGLARSDTVFKEASSRVTTSQYRLNGATGSRLLTGNYRDLQDLESELEGFLNSGASLVYNSGYVANLGFFSSVPQKSDWVLFDEYCHASIRDGIRLGNAKGYKYAHNDLASLEEQLARLYRNNPGFNGTIYVVTESVFSMDGDSPDLKTLSGLCHNHNWKLIVDEAHALGTYKAGMVSEFGLEERVFARIITFGKALGAHGAAVLGSRELKDYLLNFSRSQIYSTALPPHTVATIRVALELLQTSEGEELVTRLRNLIQYFDQKTNDLGIQQHFKESCSAIRSMVIPGNNRVKQAAAELAELGYDVRPILGPTVPQGSERLRICLHSFNSETEIDSVLEYLSKLRV